MVISKFQKYLHPNGTINVKVVNMAEKFDGLSCIFTNSKYSIQETVNLYFDRGLIEGSFRSMKSTLSLRPVRIWLEANVEVHLFICYLSYALMSILRFFLRNAQGKQGFKELKDISTEEAPDELTNICRIYLHKNQSSQVLVDQPLSRLVTLTKRQELLLKAISPELLKM